MGLNRTTISAFVLAVIAAGCGGTTVTELGGPNPTRCLTSFSTPSPTIPAAGGKASVTVSAERECTWSARGDGAWLQISPTSGQGESAITITASENPESRPRSADVIVNDPRLSGRQEPAPGVYELSSRSENVAAAGGRVSVRVSVLSGCGWTAGSTQPWVHVLTESGSGGGTVDLSVDANTGAARTAQLTIAGESFTITQDRFSPAPPPPAPPAPAPPAPTPPPPAPPPPTPGPGPGPGPPPPPPPPADCSYSIDPRARTVGARARNGDIDVRTSAGCRWTAESTVSWISIRSGATGSGNGRVEYRIDENEGLDRFGILRVAGQVFFVFQRRGGGGDDDD